MAVVGMVETFITFKLKFLWQQVLQTRVAGHVAVDITPSEEYAGQQKHELKVYNYSRIHKKPLVLQRVSINACTRHQHQKITQIATRR